MEKACPSPCMVAQGGQGRAALAARRESVTFTLLATYITRATVLLAFHLVAQNATCYWNKVRCLALGVNCFGGFGWMEPWPPNGDIVDCWQ
jgi:hypothetical protein